MNKYQSDMVFRMARDGIEPEKIRTSLKISKTEWKKHFTKADLQRLENLKTLTDYEVEDALLRRALGYKTVECKTSEKEKGTETVTTEKDVAPDVRAALAWLKFRKPDEWDTGEYENDLAKIDGILAGFEEEAYADANE